MAPPAKILWWYERLADMLIARPEATLTELAAELNCTISWLSTVKNSDVFVDYWRGRSRDASREVVGSLRAKGFAAAEMALDAINRKLAVEADSLPLNSLLEITDVSMRRFGYEAGKKSPPVPTVTLNLGIVKPEELAEARKRMRQIKLEAFDAIAEEAGEDAA